MSELPNHKPEFIAKRLRWKRWDADNPHVWPLFEAESDQLRAVASKSGAWLVINRLRWLHMLSTKGEPFKMPNDFAALYARAYMSSRKSRHAFFEIRPMLGEDWEYTKKTCGVE